MTDEDRRPEPQIVFYLWFDDDDGLKFEAGYQSDIIDRYDENEVSIFERAVLSTVNSFANQLELLNQAHGYSMD